MITDLRSHPEATEFEADICVVGAGAAGIALAREFVGSRLQVCLVESGGFEFEDATQELYDGKETGDLSPRDLLDSRLRLFGGTTNHWTGRCAPFDSIDFAHRDWVQDSGWPITRRELDPFYARAHQVCELGPFVYDQTLWTGLGVDRPRFDPAMLTTRFSQYSPPTRFGEKYKRELQDAPNVQVILHGNVKRLRANGNATQVTQCDVGTLDAKAATVRARYYVLACGGIENARLLLLSNDIAPAGLGNVHGQVGRRFMDHIFGLVGHIWLKSTGLLDVLARRAPRRDLKNPITARQAPVRPFVCLSEDLQARQRVLNSCLFVRLIDDDEDWIEPPLTQKNEPGHPYRAAIISQSETAPNRNSRVTLTNDRDALGLNKVQVDWQLSEIDKRTQFEVAKSLIAELTRLDLGRGRIASWVMSDGNDWSGALGRHGRKLEGTSHHMGSTRMSSDPKTGVVDRNCQVHGLDNLFVAGGSVFPTSGYANPTLTIVALALRLADYLKGRAG